MNKIVFSLQSIKEKASERPAGYYEDVVASGDVHDGYVHLDIGTYNKLVRKYSTDNDRTFVTEFEPEGERVPSADCYQRMLMWVLGLRPVKDGPTDVVKALQGLATTNDSIHKCSARKRQKLRMYVDHALEEGLTPPDIVIE